MRITRYLWAVLWVCFLVLPGVAGAQEEAVKRKKVQTYLDLATELFQAGDYSGALTELRRAEDLSGIPVIRFNIARCLDELDRGAEAVVAYEKYLSFKDNTKGAAERMQRARQAVARLEPLVFGGLEVACPVPNAKLMIDGITAKPVKCPWKSKRVPVGSHEVRFEAPGYSASNSTVEVEAQKTASVKGDMALAETEKMESVPPLPLPPPEVATINPPSHAEPSPGGKPAKLNLNPEAVQNEGSSTTRKVTGLALIVVGAAGLGGSGYFLYESQQSNKSIEDGGFSTAEDIEAQAKNGKKYNTYSIICGAVGGAAIVGGVIVLATGGGSSSSDERSSSLRISPQISSHGVGIVLSGALP